MTFEQLGDAAVDAFCQAGRLRVAGRGDEPKSDLNPLLGHADVVKRQYPVFKPCFDFSPAFYLFPKMQVIELPLSLLTRQQ